VLKRYHGAAGDANFDVIPAIDLRGGQVVRLAQGDFARETVYRADPAAVAAEFAAAGARRIHIVDLDGARAGEGVQTEALAAVIGAVAAVDPRIECQVAGGLRSEVAVAAALATGAARVVVGTAALRDSRFAGRLVKAHGAERIVVALDVRDGVALGDGWRHGASGVPVERALDDLADAGVTAFAVTAIARDGLLEGPDLGLLRAVIARGRGNVIASGGIGSIRDLEDVRSVGCAAAIVGRALYEGRFHLRAAIAALTGEPPPGSGAGSREEGLSRKSSP
jgi:phosphoribosylformimino-5-aminoimidazole carboxamide ribotide isomerase